MKARHIRGKPYTRAGDIVIAVNPYQWMMEYYSDRRMRQYSDALVWDLENAAKDDPRHRLDPHVYEVSALAYRGLVVNNEDQSILVSGESGAGKTETVKICLNHIASVQRGPDNSSSNASLIVQKVIDSNPLLEAFGNAKTRRNDNSSRFGKYLQLQFDTGKHAGSKHSSKLVPTCPLVGSKCETYLLEKSRVVGHDSEERTFHIFYQLLAAPDRVKAKIWEDLSGKTKESFAYIGWTDTDMIEGKSDAARWNSTIDSLTLIGVQKDKLNTLMRAICVVLQLGNISFQADAHDQDRCSISNRSELLALADLMGIAPEELQTVLTVRTMSTKGESCKVPLSASRAKESCDAFAKEIYSKTFLWLVRAINQATSAEDNYMGGSDKSGIIGLLDIFGFERFDNNRFEQLCINYANEKLQQKFNNDMFKAVQAEYELEGVPLDEIKYDDNVHVLDLIEGRMGLLDVLNDECYGPQGSDMAFVEKAVKENSRSPCLIKPKGLGTLQFGIRHYAGNVSYDATNFVNTNNDALATDLQDLAAHSSNEIISKELKNNNQETRPTGHPSKANFRKFAAPRVVKRPSNIVAPTVWTKYKNQLSTLMSKLAKTQSRYVRCIKPNEQKKPVLLEHQTTVEQLRCAGVIAAITIARSAFPNRVNQDIVLHRFRGLWPAGGKGPTKNDDSNKTCRSDCDRLLTPVLKHMEKHEGSRLVKAFVLGNTKVYFRAGALEYLEAERLKWAEQHSIDEDRLAQEEAEKQARERAMALEMEKAKQKAVEKAATNAKEHKRAAVKIQALARGVQQRANFADFKKRQTEVNNLKKQLQDLQEQLTITEEQHKADLDAVEARRLQEAEELEQEIEETRRAASSMSKKLTPEQEARLAETEKVIENLRKENAKLRNSTKQAQADFECLKRNQKELAAANLHAHEQFNILNENAKRQNDQNMKLKNNEQILKNQVTLLKDELKTMQGRYVAVAETRLLYQQGLADLFDMVQQRCTNDQLVEDVTVSALEIQRQAKAERAALDFEVSGGKGVDKSKQSGADAVPGADETDESCDSEVGSEQSEPLRA